MILDSSCLNWDRKAFLEKQESELSLAVYLGMAGDAVMVQEVPSVRENYL